MRITRKTVVKHGVAGYRACVTFNHQTENAKVSKMCRLMAQDFGWDLLQCYDSLICFLQNEHEYNRFCADWNKCFANIEK